MFRATFHTRVEVAVPGPAPRPPLSMPRERTSGMARLIVHGDDCGLAPHITDGILEAHRTGILTSTSISACGEDFARAAELLRATPTLDVGVHLTLVEERSLLDPREVRSLLDTKGRFHRHATVFVRRALFRRISFSEVRGELDAQIRTVVDHGLTPTHLDSHQHVHFLPEVLSIVTDLARAYGIPAIRLPRRMSEPPSPGSGGLARTAQLVVLDRLARRGGRRMVLSRTHGFRGFFAGGRLDQEAVLHVLDTLPPEGTFELMCHPGQPDAASPYAHWGYRWEDELEALTSERTREGVEENGIHLIDYRDLSPT